MLLSVVSALLLDYLFQEPRRWHPLVGFGRWANRIETRLNRPQPSQYSGALRRAGVFAWCITVIPWVLLAAMVEVYSAHVPWLHVILGAGMLYLAVGWQSLLSHARAVQMPLIQGDLTEARQAVGRIVSRDTQALDEAGVASAATESVLENGADAIFAAIFWFCIAGIPGVVLYRLSNTLDAMWGYKNTRFVHFGWAAARIDDVLNWIPARLTALSYMLSGRSNLAWQAWRQQGQYWKSPNAGPVMASGAGAINTLLGGAAPYHGQLQSRPALGPTSGDRPRADTIQRACTLVNRALGWWIGSITVISLAAWLGRQGGWL